MKKQINIFDINWNKVQKTIMAIAILILLSIVLNNCNGKNTVIAEYQTKKQALTTQINQSKSVITSLKNDIKNLEKEKDSITKLKNKVIVQKIKENVDPIKKYSIDQQQDYFTANYKRLLNPLKFVTIDSLQAFNVITDIELGKIAKYEVGELNKIISNDSIQFGKYKLQLLEFEKVEENYNAVIEDCEDALYKSQKQINFRLLVGGGLGISKELNQGLYKVNLGFQNKKGNVAFASYMKIGSVDYILGEYNFSIFKLREK